MGFSLFFWRANKGNSTVRVAPIQPPSSPSAVSQASATPLTSSTPPMPRVRDTSSPSVENHPRLQRMAEALATLPSRSDPISTLAPYLVSPTTSSSVSLPVASPAIPDASLPVSSPASSLASSSDTSHQPSPSGMDESLHEHHERNSLSSVSGAVRGERVEVRVAEKPLLVVEDAPKTPLFWEPTVENLSPSHPSSLDSFPSHSSSHLSSLHSSSLASRTHFTPPEEHPSLPEYHAEKHAASSLSLETRASNAFYAANGAVYWTLAQLADALLTMDEATFTHHVNDARNDFASWVTGCFTGNEQAFAERLRVRSRKSMIQEFLALTPKRESTRLSPSSQSVQHQSPSSPLPSAYHDEKQPVAVSWRPAQLEERNALVRTVLEQLTQARFLAATDIGRAREQFIAARTRVFSELSESERVAVLPKLRDTYEYLRHLR